MGRMLSVVLCAVALVVALSPAAVAEAGSGRLVEADPFTDTAGPLAPGELELAVLSTRAETVTGGDALVGVRGLDSDDVVHVSRNGKDVSEHFALDDDGVLVGLVTGLEMGRNEVAVVAEHPAHGRRVASLPIDNHPIEGPVFSGPHQEPFYCQTAQSGLGEPLDDDCSAEPRVEWVYFDDLEQDFVPLADPYGPYPSTTATATSTNGETVPYVVRVESRTINRGITRVAVLDDPAARGPEAEYQVSEAWNERVLYQWGASCGVGRHQGTNDLASVTTNFLDVGTGALTVPGRVVESPLAQGYLTAASTLTTLGVHCNQVLSAETFMMVTEHVAERYGRPAFVMGNGASGGAIQQVTTMDSYPGLLDGAVPMLTFPDVITTAMSPADCRLLLDVFARDQLVWNELAIQAVTGHRTSQVCRDWDDLFAGHLVASSGCDGAVPDDAVYDPETNPGGVRCTLPDALVNLMGIDPETGFANRPLDNTGVQYGRTAFDGGLITAEMFVTLNEQVGGFDIDGNLVDERMSMAPELARRMYEIGAVGGRGALAEGPSIFISTYVDVVPVLGFHDAVRAYMLRERLLSTVGTHDTQAIWAGLPLPNDAWPVMDDWLTTLGERRAAAGGTSDSGWLEDVVASRPARAKDACVATTAGLVDGGVDLVLDAGRVGGACETLFAPLGSPRTVAGGPLAEDIIKCQLRPIGREVDGAGLTDGQWDRLAAVFPDGVCDWDQPGVGEVERSRTWLDFGDVPGATPTPIGHRVARSEVVAAPPAGPPPSAAEPATRPAPAPASSPVPLPATGGSAVLVGLTLLGAWRAVRRDART